MPDDLRPIRGIMATDNVWLERLLIAAAVILVIAAAYFAYRAYRKWKSGKTAPVALIPPQVRAEKDMEALLKEGLFEKGLHKEYYFRFTEIIKRYVGEVRHIPALECTTEEMARLVKDEDRPIIEILKSADLVKFADQPSDSARKQDEVSAFLAYIDVTSIVPASEEDGGTGAKSA